MHFERALSSRGLLSTISREEFDTICKCFSFEGGMRHGIDYRAFIKGLDVMYSINKYKPF